MQYTTWKSFAETVISGQREKEGDRTRTEAASAKKTYVTSNGPNLSTASLVETSISHRSRDTCVPY